MSYTVPINMMVYGIYAGNKFFHCNICLAHKTELWMCIHCGSHFTNKRTWKRHIGPYTSCSLHSTSLAVVDVITT